jgi:plasmid maintenance system antidote protein VapI
MTLPEIKLHSPAHIGDFVREIIEGHDLNVTTGAAVLGVTRQALSNLVNRDCGLSSDMALRIERRSA